MQQIARGAHVWDFKVHFPFFLPSIPRCFSKVLESTAPEGCVQAVDPLRGLIGGGIMVVTCLVGGLEPFFPIVGMMIQPD